MRISAKRAFLLSDSHFGARSNSNEWLDLILKYFYEDFIPTVKKEYKKGDILLHCGDFFDNRQSLNLSVLHESIKLIEELSKIFEDGVYMIVGNHDIFKKTSNEITSLDSFKYIPNVNIIKESILLELDNKNIMLMPWQSSIEDERSEIEKFKKYNPQYLFCHTDVKTLQFDKVRKIEDGLDPTNLKDFKKVYTGHIHTAQKHKNITVIGNSYQMTRSDSNNKKGFYLIDFESDKEYFFENKTSPKFFRVYLHKFLENPISDVISICNNNKIDLYIESNLLKKYQVQIAQIIDILSKYANKLEIIPFDEVSEDMTGSDELIEHNFNIIGLCEKFVKTLNYDDCIKNELINKIDRTYNKILKDIK